MDALLFANPRLPLGQGPMRGHLDEGHCYPSEGRTCILFKECEVSDLSGLPWQLLPVSGSFSG